MFTALKKLFAAKPENSLPSSALGLSCANGCQMDEIGPIRLTQDGNFANKHYRLAHCPNCDVVWLDPKPTAADLKIMYDDGIQFSDAVYTDATRVSQVLDYLGGCVRTRALLPASGSGAMLEVGAGLAWMARTCKSINPNIRTVAQDVTHEAEKNCPWVDQYFVGQVESLPSEETFDLISLTHVIEHLLDPAAMIRLLSKKLNPGGAIFITAPYRPIGWKTGDAIDAWSSYSYLHVPAHIGYLSKQFFAQQCAAIGDLKLEHWDASHEQGQAYEVVLRQRK
jgi:SAM-dependent methyltransferase